MGAATAATSPVYMNFWMASLLTSRAALLRMYVTSAWFRSRSSCSTKVRANEEVTDFEVYTQSHVTPSWHYFWRASPRLTFVHIRCRTGCVAPLM